jgi:hypothetical protein
MDDIIVSGKKMQNDLPRSSEPMSGETSSAPYELTPELQMAIEWACLGGD